MPLLRTKAVQRGLKALGFFELPVTGTCDQQTRFQVETYALALGLSEADTIVECAGRGRMHIEPALVTARIEQALSRQTQGQARRATLTPPQTISSGSPIVSWPLWIAAAGVTLAVVGIYAMRRT